MRQALPQGFLGLIMLATGLTACQAPAALGSLPAAAPVSALAARTAAVDTAAFMPGSLPKARRMVWSSGRSRVTLPTHVDLRPQMTPVGDQLSREAMACTGFAMAGVAEYLAKKRGESVQLSAGFMYVRELVHDGHPGASDAGSWIATGMKVLKAEGIAPEALHPFMTLAQVGSWSGRQQYCATPPSKEAFEAAKAYRIGSYSQAGTFEEMKQALADGKPVPFIFAIYPGFRTPECASTGIVPLPNLETEKSLGLHAVVAVGYDDATQRVIFRQCRGPKFGEQGYGFMPYGYFRQELVGDAWKVDS